MYFDYFGLQTPPFNNTPDPRFFFNTPDHEEALASLLYAVQERKGFVLVTGEVGAGKTLLSRILLNRLEDNVKSALITNTRLDGPQLLYAVCREFELDVADNLNSAQYISALEAFLLEQYARDRIAVVIIDEAQNLSTDAIEELRMLGNLEADDAKLLQVLLLGQPELQTKFRDPNLKQAFQRVFRTFHLPALDRELTRRYVRHRLNVAGLARGEALFDDKAMDAIYEFTEGVPRLINQLCDNALLSAYGESRRIISAELIADVVNQMMSLNVPIGGRSSRGNEWPPSSRGANSPEASLNSAQRRHDETLSQLIQSVGKGLDEAQEESCDIPESVEDADATSVLDEAMSLPESEIPHHPGTAGTRSAIEELHATTRRQQAIIARLVEATRRESRTARLQQTAVEKALAESRAEVQASREYRKQALELCQRAVETHDATKKILSAALEEARGVTGRVERESKTLLSETRSRNAELQEQLHLLINDMRERGDAVATRTSDIIARHEADVSASRERYETLATKIEEQSTRLDIEHRKVIDHVKSQADDIVSHLSEMGATAATKARRVSASADELMHDMTSRVAAAQERIDAGTAAAEEQIRKTSEQFVAMRDAILNDAKEKSLQAQALIEKTQAALEDTRNRCDSMLAELRSAAEQQSASLEKALHARISRGAATLEEITDKLADARRAAEKSRADLEALVRTATSEAAAARAALDTAFARHQDELVRLSKDAGALTDECRSRFDEARVALDALIQTHRSDTSHRVDELAGSIRERIAAAENEAVERVRAVQGQLRVAGESASRISVELRSAVEAAEAHLGACRVQTAQSSNEARREINQIVEASRSAIDAARAQADRLTQQADETSRSMQNEINGLKREAAARLDMLGQDFARLLSDTSHKLDAVREEAETFADTLAQRMADSRSEAETVLTESQKACAALRLQSKSALTEVRDCLAQMNARADQLRRELCGVGDEIAASARNGTSQVQRTADRVAGEIESMREAVQRDADANFHRLGLFREQVESGAEQIRRNAAQLLDQIAGGSEALRKHADELLMRAQAGADKVNDSAGQLLENATAASERFRTQAEELLRRTESTAADIREQITAMRAQVAGETQDIRNQITAARHDLAEARGRVEQIGEKTAAKQQLAESKAVEMLREAQSVREKSEQLLAMPRELVDEARRQAEALSTMSRKITTALHQLGLAEQQAARNKNELDKASSTADQKVDLLKRHTERVGQLVGIIRQLYGTMDARLERLRGRLTQADDLVRDVPREIEHLRAAFDSDDGLITVNSMQSRIGTGPAVATQPRKQGARQTGTAAVNRKPVATPIAQEQEDASSTLRDGPSPAETSTMPSGSLAGLISAGSSMGDLVRKNQKLNEWLQQMVGDEALEARIQRNQARSSDDRAATVENKAQV